MHYQVWLPACTNDAAQRLAEVGLDDHVANAESVAQADGPDKAGPGMLCAWRKPGAAGMHYNPAEQTWIPAMAFEGREAGRYWIGLWDDSLVTPDDLARPRRYQGPAVTLGDGQSWQIPSVTLLPKVAKADAHRNWSFSIAPEFAEVERRATEWLALVAEATNAEGTGGINLSVDGSWVEFALLVLSMNYRLTAEVTSHLNLFTDVALGEIMLAVVSGWLDTIRKG